MLDHLGKLFLGKVLGRLLGQELGEDFGGDVAHHRRLKTDAGETLGEELTRAARGPFGPEAPRLLLGGSIERQMEAQVVGDRQGGARV
jgi:hypothetical protein